MSPKWALDCCRIAPRCYVKKSWRVPGWIFPDRLCWGWGVESPTQLKLCKEEHLQHLWKLDTTKFFFAAPWTNHTMLWNQWLWNCNMIVMWELKRWFKPTQEQTFPPPCEIQSIQGGDCNIFWRPTFSKHFSERMSTINKCKQNEMWLMIKCSYIHVVVCQKCFVHLFFGQNHDYCCVEVNHC